MEILILRQQKYEEVASTNLLFLHIKSTCTIIGINQAKSEDESS